MGRAFPPWSRARLLLRAWLQIGLRLGIRQTEKRMSHVLLDSLQLGRTLDRIAHEIAERNPAGIDLALIGVQRGGRHLGQRLVPVLERIWGHSVPHGELDVSMHRDDLNDRGTLVMHPTRIPFDLDGKTVVLVDDVLFTGRTTRAALDALNDYGRPRAVQLAVLVDRGHRELPIQADFVGTETRTTLEQRVDVQWKEDGGEDRVVLEQTP